jgi:hypothetical protein
MKTTSSHASCTAWSTLTGRALAGPLRALDLGDGHADAHEHKPGRERARETESQTEGIGRAPMLLAPSPRRSPKMVPSPLSLQVVTAADTDADGSPEPEAER